MPGIQRPSCRRPRRVGRERTEPPHVDDPVHTRHRLEAKRRDRIQDGQDETDRVGDLKTNRQSEREQLADHEQRDTEMQQIPRQRRRRVQVPDVSLILIEDAVDRERAAVQKNHPDRECAKRLRQPRTTHYARESHREHVAQQRMSRHDGPLGGTHVQDVGVQIAGEDAVSPATPCVQRAGVGHHLRPSAVAAIRRPTSVKSG